MDCTSSCRLPRHAYAILSAITREDLTTFKTILKRICSNSRNLTDRLGRHAIHIATSCGKTEILKWLIEDCKVNLELRDLENGWTALHRAVFYGQINCAELLLQYGANVYALDKEDLTPLDLLLLDSPFKLSTSVDGKVVASYDTKLDDELCLYMGDVITNIHMSGPSYWTGNLKGTRGFFPKRCVELIKQDYRSDLYTWGTNTNFTLGHQDESLRHNPEMIETFNNDRTICITEVVMCKFHTVFLSQDGRVFTCGHGRGGRLGHGNEQTQLAPKRVEGLKEHHCVAMAAAHNHTIVVTDSGSVFTFGLNDMQQLGHAPVPSQCLLPRMIQMKPWRGKQMIGVSAGQYHSVMFTYNEVFTCGLNIGQLGHLKGEKFITTPRQVTSLHHKDINIAMVTCSDSSTICATSKGDIFLLSQYTCQKIITRFMELTRLIVSGGDVELSKSLEITKYHDKPSLTLLSGNGLVYQWKESYGSLRKTKWMCRKELVVADIAVGKQLYIITDCGELYDCTKAGGDAPVTKPTWLSSSSSSNIVDKGNWDQKEPVVHYDVKRCPMVHQGIRIFTDSKSKVFGVLRVDPSTGLKFSPVVSPSTMCGEFKQLLEETVSDDDLHDVNLLVKGLTIPAHRFILASKSPKFHDLLAEKNTLSGQDGKVKTLKLDNVEYDEVMRYVEDLYSGFNIDDTVLFGTKKTHKTIQQNDSNKHQQHVNQQQRKQPDNHQHQQETNSTNGLSHDSEFDINFLKDLEFLCMEDLEEFSTMTNKQHDESSKAVASDSVVSPAKKEPKNKKKSEQNGRTSSKKEAKNQTKRTFKGLKFQRTNCPEMCDVTIESADGVQFSCHKCVLIARLDYFRSMLAFGWLETSNETRVLNMPIDSGVLQVVLDYLYTDEAKILKSNQSIEFIGNVMVIADQLLISRLREICEAAMAKLISHRNVMELLEFSCVYNADQLRRCCLEYICNNLGSLLELGSLGSLNQESLDILSKAYKEAIPRMPWRMITPQFDHVYALMPEPSSSPSKKRRSSARQRSMKSESEAEVEVDGPVTDSVRHNSTLEDDARQNSLISDVVDDSVFEEDIEEEIGVDDEDMKNIEDKECEVKAVFPEKQADVGQWYRKKDDDLEYKRPSKSPSPAKTRSNKEHKPPSTKPKDIPKSKPQEKSPQCPWSTGNPATSPISSGFRAIMEQELQATPLSTTTAKSPCKVETRGKQSQKQRKRALLMQEKENAERLSKEKEDTVVVKETKSPVNPWAIPNKSPISVRSLRELIDQEEKSQRTLSKTSLKTSPNKPKSIDKRKDKSADKTSKISWGLRHLEKTEDDSRHEPPTSPKTAWQSLGSSPPPSSVSFADILHVQERENTILARKKPLNLIQIEDRAIQELLDHYGGRANACEMITVERVRTTSAIPVWNRTRTNSAMKS